MPTTTRSTTLAAATTPVRTRGATDEAKPATRERPKQIENITRVTVAFPFATIRTAEPDTTRAVQHLAELVVDLATELDASRSTPATAELVERARTLAETVTG